jgi:hypothetical protein
MPMIQAHQAPHLKFLDWTTVEIPEKRFLEEFGNSNEVPELLALHAALNEWVDAHASGRVVRMWLEAERFGGDVLRVYFESPKDAFAYKLRWA